MFTHKEANALKELLVSGINQQRALITKGGSDKSEEELEAKLINLVSVHNKVKVLLNKLQKNPPSATMPKILVVDDAESMIGITCKILSEMGFRKVDSAKSAEKALTMLLEAAEEKSPYQIVLTDWEMTGKTGLDLLKDIRITESLLETEVFIVSSHSEQEFILQAIQSGVTGYMLKPLNFNTLDKKLRGYLPSEEDDAKAITPNINLDGQAVKKPSTETEKVNKSAEVDAKAPSEAKPEAKVAAPSSNEKSSAEKKEPAPQKTE